tara:strand:- start:7529 stop:8656 length:1128 start_codon:yes stop_codon:yes gene_type:complete
MQTQSVLAVHPAKYQSQLGSNIPGIAHSKRSSKLTAPGFLFVFVTLFLALGAINGQNNLLFWLFGFSIASLVVSGIITGSAIINIKLAAHPLLTTELGSTLKASYTLYNPSKLLPNFALEITELDHPQSKATPGVVFHLKTNSAATAHTNLSPQSRGQLSLSTIRVSTRFPFGLFVKSVDYQIHRQMLVLPMPIDSANITTPNQSTAATSETRSLNRRGSGLDYFALRQYQPGDPLRRIAWKQSARSDSILVTEYPETANAQRTIELAEPSADTPDEHFERAISIAYTLIKDAPPNTRIALSIPWDGVVIPSMSGRAHIDRCSKALALLSRTHASSNPKRTTSRNKDTLTIGYARSTDQTQSTIYAEDFASDTPQ